MGSYGDGYRDARKHAAHETQIAVRNATAELRAENERLREALRYYAANHYPNVDDGPWGPGSTDFGDVARAALGEDK